ncbi:unnamed protein product, partial [Pelagomonas calceolata]
SALAAWYLCFGRGVRYCWCRWLCVSLAPRRRRGTVRRRRRRRGVEACGPRRFRPAAATAQVFMARPTKRADAGDASAPSHDHMCVARARRRCVELEIFCSRQLSGGRRQKMW